MKANSSGMRTCKKKGQAFWARRIHERFRPGVELQFVGTAPKYTPYMNIEDGKTGEVLASVSGVRELKQLKRAIEIALGER